MSSLVGTLLVALLSSGSAILAVFITNRATEKRLEIQSKLESERELYRTRLLKAEEIYSSLSEFKLMIFNIHLDWVRLAQNDLTLTEVSKKASGHTKIDVNLLLARLGIYFPELHAKFEENRKLLKPANDCYLAMTTENAIEIDRKRGFVKEILDSGHKFDQAMDVLLLDLSRKVNQF